MKLVIVKHENCGQKYLFALPDDEYVYAGDKVIVKTKNGNESVATCLCDSYKVDESNAAYKDILNAMGAKEPLSRVVGKYYESRFKEDKSENEDKE